MFGFSGGARKSKCSLAPPRLTSLGRGRPSQPGGAFAASTYRDAIYLSSVALCLYRIAIYSYRRSQPLPSSLRLFVYRGAVACLEIQMACEKIFVRAIRLYRKPRDLAATLEGLL